MKKLFLVVTLLLCINAYSQEEGKFRVGMDLGYAAANGGGGILFSIEPKYNIKNNMNVGLSIKAAGMLKNVDLTPTASEDFNGTVTDVKSEFSIQESYLGTFDYYFPKSGSSFAPFVGAGLGFTQLANFKLDSSYVNNNGTNPENVSNSVNWDSTTKFGGMIRGGFEYGKLRVGIEYNLIGKSTLKDLKGNDVGAAKNSYLGFTIGFYLGGGKWANN